MNNRNEIKATRFPVSLFWQLLVSLLILSGLHQGIVMAMYTTGFNGLIQTVVAIGYWIIVSFGLVYYTMMRVRKVYDVPLHEISEVTKKVAEGDFSVRLKTNNSEDKMDYLDVMADDLNTMIEELGSIETLKTDFISNVSHEMKTPLSVIKNYSEMMLQDNLPEGKRKEYSVIIGDAAVNMSELITNILKLNRLEHQVIVPKAEKYDLCRQLAECIMQFDTSLEEKNIDMDVDIEEKAIITADESLLVIVWNNLISNAIKFTEPGGKIVITETSQNGKIVVTVSDNGCGISKEAKDRIFDKFYQADTSHATEGNGLGLALALKIIVLMNGTIEVESELAKGSTFTVTLPTVQ